MAWNLIKNEKNDYKSTKNDNDKINAFVLIKRTTSYAWYIVQSLPSSSVMTELCPGATKAPFFCKMTSSADPVACWIVVYGPVKLLARATCQSKLREKKIKRNRIVFVDAEWGTIGELVRKKSGMRRKIWSKKKVLGREKRKEKGMRKCTDHNCIICSGITTVVAWEK